MSAGLAPHPKNASPPTSPIQPAPYGLASRAGSAALPIAGYASLFGVRDLGGDVVARGAFAQTLARRGPLPMLRQHGAPPVGTWDAAREDGRGLFVSGRIDTSTPDGHVAAALHKAGVLDGLSIGYRARRAHAEGRVRVLSQVDLFEVSLVSFPMLPAARFGVTGG